MERSEPSFIPGWLKGAAGGGLTTNHYEDGGGLSRTKPTQQLLAVGNHIESPRGSVASDRVFSPSSRRQSNSSLERPASERDHFSTVRLHSGLNRSSSTRSHDMSKGERDVRSDREYEHEGDRDFHSRKKEPLLGIVSDEREKNREYGENGMLRFSPAGLSGKYDTDMKLRRSQSMGLSPRLSDSGLRKLTEVVSTVPSASGGLATSMQKAIFEHNFPSLGADEKQSSLLLSSGNASIGSPRPLWQGSPRPDLSRASSPGLSGGFANSISTVSASVSACDGGIDVWSSALAEAPTSNGNVQGNSFAVNVAPVSSSSQTSASVISGPAATMTPLNMAEALTQNPPRVRTPPQLSLESQRLEELALRQSRQLIPMTPSLPKTMSLVDKAKSKTLRTVDGTTSKLNQLSGSLQLNSSHKSVMPARLDTPKHSQGKLLVLKSSKDGGVTVSTTSKSDGTNVSQVTPQGNIGLTAASATNVAGMSVPATGVLGQRRQAHDRRAPSLPAGAAVPDGLRAKDPTLLVDDRRPSLQAQNRSDFFNALRKKAAGNGSNSKTSGSSNQTKSGLLSPREATIVNEDAPVGHDSESKDNGVGEHSHCTLSSLESGGLKDSSENGLIMDSPVKDFSVVESQEESLHSFLLGDSEEEEAAFMRSLGWEENAEGSELTEEEINAFYQMRERKKLLNNRGNHNLKPLGVGHFVGSVGSMSSGLSSSDSETDEEPSSLLLRRALSNTVH